MEIETLIIISIIISVIALFISSTTSITSLYYLYIQKAKLQFNHVSQKYGGGAGEGIFYNDFIVIVNKGHKTGIIKEIESKSESDIQIQREKLEIIARCTDRVKISDEPPFAVVAVPPKESIVFILKNKISSNKEYKPDYKIIFKIDTNVNCKKLDEKSMKTIEVVKL